MKLISVGKGFWENFRKGNYGEQWENIIHAWKDEIEENDELNHVVKP